MNNTPHTLFSPPKALVTVVAAMLVVTASAGIVDAQEEMVAQLSQAKGHVTITRAATGEEEAVGQLGPRVRNGSVNAGDLITTHAASRAVVVFSDGSTLEMAENTRIEIIELDRSADVAKGIVSRPLVRRIKLIQGDLWNEVVDNPDVGTELDLPSGLLSVLGTSFSTSVDERGRSVMLVEDGTVSFANPSFDVSTPVSGGQQITTWIENDVFVLEVGKNSTGSLLVTVGDEEVELFPGDVIRIPRVGAYELSRGVIGLERAGRRGVLGGGPNPPRPVSPARF